MSTSFPNISNSSSLQKMSKLYSKLLSAPVLYFEHTVCILLRPAGSIQDYRHFAAGFIGILLNTDAGSIRGRAQLE